MTTERLAPDAILVQTGLTGVLSAIQDDPDSPNGSWLTTSSNTSTDLRVSFPTPSGSLTTGAGLQGIRVLVRKTGQSTNPTVVVELWQSGSLVSTLVASTTVSSTTGVVLAGSFDASSLSDPTGAGVEVRVNGTPGGGSPSNRASVEVGAIEWNTTESAAPTTISGSFTANAEISAAGGSASYDEEVATDSPVIYLKMEDASGTVADSSGNGHNASATGALTYGANGPKTGTKGIQFGGGHLSVADNADLDLGDGPFSIEFWFKRDSDTSQGYLLDKGDDSTAPGYAVELREGSPDNLRLQNGATSSNIVSTGNINDANWHHIVITRAAGADGTIYIDGVEGHSGSNTLTFTDSNLPLVIGSLSGGTGGVAGTMSRFAIYKTQLSSTRVAAHFAASMSSAGTGSFTANAVIKRLGIGGTFTANAYVKKAQSGSLTANAYVKRLGLSGSLTADALVRRTFSGSFTANANIASTIASTFTADAYVKIIPTGSVTADALIKRNLSGSLTADALVRITPQGSLTADAAIRRTFSGSLVADAIVRVLGRPGSFTADAWIANSGVSVLTLDANIAATVAGSFTADAFVRTTQTGSLTANAHLAGTVARSFTADAVLTNSTSGHVTLDANIAGTVAGSLTADAFVRRTASGSLTADAIVRVTKAGSISADADVRRTFGASVTVDAHVSATVAHSFTADAQLSEPGVTTRGSSLTVDAYIRSTGSGSFTADGLVLVPRAGSLTADAHISSATTTFVTADAYIRTTTARTITADAFIRALVTSGISADAFVLVTTLGSITADGHIAATLAGTLTLSATINNPSATKFVTGTTTAVGFGGGVGSFRYTSAKPSSRIITATSGLTGTTSVSYED